MHPVTFSTAARGGVHVVVELASMLAVLVLVIAKARTTESASLTSATSSLRFEGGSGIGLVDQMLLGPPLLLKQARRRLIPMLARFFEVLELLLITGVLLCLHGFTLPDIIVLVQRHLLPLISLIGAKGHVGRQGLR